MKSALSYNKAQEMFGSIQALTKSERLILDFMLGMTAHYKGRIFPSYDTIAKRTGVSERTICRFVCKIKKNNLIDVQQFYDKRCKRFSSNSYHLNKNLIDFAVLVGRFGSIKKWEACRSKVSLFIEDMNIKWRPGISQNGVVLKTLSIKENSKTVLRENSSEANAINYFNKFFTEDRFPRTFIDQIERDNRNCSGFIVDFVHAIKKKTNMGIGEPIINPLGWCKGTRRNILLHRAEGLKMSLSA